MSNLRQTAQQIFQQTLAAIDVETVMREHLRLNGDRLEVGHEAIALSAFARLIVVAIGKAAVPMARAIETLLGDRITNGLVVTNAVVGDVPHLPVILGGHPLPNAGSLEAATQALQLLRDHDADDTLVLFLISGGGSALFEKPVDDTMTLDDLQTINRVLVGCGAVIGEMNVVRRFLSAVKGGRLAAAAPRARQMSLYISDVNSDDLSTVSSGLTMPSTATREDFVRIVKRYDLHQQFPAHIAALIASNTLPDLPQANEVTDQQRTHHLLLDNRQALREAQRIAEREFDCLVEIADDLVEGDVETMMLAHLERIVMLRYTYPGRRVCVLSGGEVICPVRGNGQGGRSQEFVLRAAIHLHQQELENVVVLSAGTDGIDGHSPAAGAIADTRSLQRAAAEGISVETHLRNSDSYHFFAPLGDALLTGPTGNNVRDLRILLAE